MNGRVRLMSDTGHFCSCSCDSAETGPEKADSYLAQRDERSCLAHKRAGDGIEQEDCFE